MNDCTNAEMRDQLPDLLHMRLDESARATVVAHVNDCIDCRDELQLLRDVQSMMTQRTPRVDVNYVIGALPKAPVRAPLRVERRRPVWADWRVAAAVTLLVAGGGSFALMNTDRTQPAAAVAETVAVAPVVEGPTDNRLDGLSDEQLNSLLEDIGDMKAVPSTEADPVTIQIGAIVGSEGL